MTSNTVRPFNLGDLRHLVNSLANLPDSVEPTIVTRHYPVAIEKVVVRFSPEPTFCILPVASLFIEYPSAETLLYGEPGIDNLTNKKPTPTTPTTPTT